MAAFKGAGTKIYRKSDLSAYVAMGSQLEFDLPEGARSTEDITAADTTDNAMDFFPGLVDGGEMMVTGLFGYSAWSTLNTDLYVDTARDWKVELPDADTTTWEFSCFVVGVKTLWSKGESVKLQLRLKITGKPTDSTSSV